jgi:gas vesicle protein
MYENSSERDNNGNSMLAFGIGMIAGAVTALLLAPASGQETRRRIGHVAQKVSDKAKDSFESGKQFVQDQKGRFTSAIEEGKQTYRKESTPSSTL